MREILSLTPLSSAVFSKLIPAISTNPYIALCYNHSLICLPCLMDLSVRHDSPPRHLAVLPLRSPVKHEHDTDAEIIFLDREKRNDTNLGKIQGYFTLIILIALALRCYTKYILH
ncbi:3-hydroxy-3-methylglutaryl-coenzyme A reductase [Fusarium oxysporum f. sp. albedinis]|nr:3-hydroxy-3-methylglutaryl-coenzyme A reductase [Fusarium oxysporum f. sp. albedinis]